jgi:hypothetical protein
MNTIRNLRLAWLFAAAGALALSACGEADHQGKAGPQAQAGPPPASTSSTPPSQLAQSDTKSDTNANETAKASDEPMKPMNKDEEEKAMPQPGQANDHSTLAQEPKQPKEEK